jgi:uncharacterized protein
VYLHKTVVSAEQLMVKILERAKELARNKVRLFASPYLGFFLENAINIQDFNDREVLEKYASLDDTDIIMSIKVWAEGNDPVLQKLCKFLIDRRLFKTEFADSPFPAGRIENIKKKLSNKYSLSVADCKYFVFSDSVQNSLYDSKGTKISMLLNDETVVDFADTTSGFNFSGMTEPDQRYFLCYPKDITDKQLGWSSH